MQFESLNEFEANALGDILEVSITPNDTYYDETNLFYFYYLLELIYTNNVRLHELVCLKAQ